METPSPVAAVARPLTSNAPAVILLLLLVDSTHYIFAKLMAPYLPPGAAAMYVLAVATLEVAVFAHLWGGGIRLDVLRRHLWFFLSIGFLVAASTNINYAVVRFINPGVAALLAKTNILFGLAFGILWLKEVLNAMQIVGAVAAIVGVIVVTFQPGEFQVLGSLLVLGSVLMYSTHTALVKRYGDQMDLTNFFFFRLLSTTVFLFVFTTWNGELVWPSLPAWLMLLLVGTVDVVISRSLYYLALRKLKLSVHTIVLTSSPVLALIWAFLLFQDVPTLQEIIGGIAVLGGVLLVTLYRTSPARP